MWHSVGTQHRLERVVYEHSSTRVELVAVVMALQGTPRTDDIAIPRARSGLIDSTAGCTQSSKVLEPLTPTG